MTKNAHMGLYYYYSYHNASPRGLNYPMQPRKICWLSRVIGHLARELWFFAEDGTTVWVGEGAVYDLCDIRETPSVKGSWNYIFRLREKVVDIDALFGP